MCQIMYSAKSNLIMTQLYRCTVNFCIYVCKIYFFIIITGNANYFHYTKQGGSPVIDGVDDAKEMMNTRQACTLLGNW